MLVFHQSNRVSTIKSMLFYYSHLRALSFNRVFLVTAMYAEVYCVTRVSGYVIQYNKTIPKYYRKASFTMKTSDATLRLFGLPKL